MFCVRENHIVVSSEDKLVDDTFLVETDCFLFKNTRCKYISINAIA